MKINSKEIAYCTYFDRNYLIKGLSMCTSLLKHSPDTILFVLCMDEYTEKTLNEIKLKNLRIIKLVDFEDKELLKAKKNRKFFEYYWTCTPSLPLYIFKKFNQFRFVTYVDADLFFYSTPEIAFEELGENSILTVEHRYPKGQEGRLITSGRFNVAFQIFKRDKNGLSCLERWRKQCNEWCYYRYEDGKMGDQLYLNEWPDLYQNLVISQNLGIDAAPWNIKQYSVNKSGNNVFINQDKLISYHFHELQILSESSFDLCTGYFLSKPVVKFIYNPYLKSLQEQIKKLKSIDPEFIINPPERSLYLKVRSYLVKRFGPLFWNLQTYIVKDRDLKIIGINALFMIPNQVGGTEYHLRSFINYLAKIDKKNRYIIFCNQENYSSFENLNNNWKRMLCQIEAKNRIKRILYEQFVFPFIVWKNHCQVLHSYGYFGPILTTAKHVITVHDANWKDHPRDIPTLQRLTLKFLIEMNLKTAEKVIVDSDFSSKRLTHHFPTTLRKVSVVKAGIDDNFKDIAREKIVHPFEGKKYILCVSAFYPHKKISYLLEVWKEIVKIDKELNLVIIGHNGTDEKVILNSIKYLPRVHQTHKVSLKKLVEYYKFAKCFVLPSTYEGFGFPVYEAIYMGVTTFVGDVSMYDSSIRHSLKGLSWDPKKDAKSILSVKKNTNKIDILDYRDSTKKLINIYETI